MLFLIRFITTIGLFGLLFFQLWLGSLFLGGFLLAVREDAVVPANNPEFEDKYFTTVTVGVLVTTLVMAAGVSFSGILPWCRKKTPAAVGPAMVLAPVAPAAAGVTPDAPPAPVMPRPTPPE
jgi:hypothetical protein